MTKDIPFKTSKITDFWNIYKKTPEKNEIKIINMTNITNPTKMIPQIIQKIMPSQQPLQQPSQPLPLSSLSSINVYTDGSCIHNGKPNAKAGIGVYFGENDNRNVSRRVVGKQSNNTAELTAIITALIILRDEIMRGDNIIIHTDSEYSIKCMTTYGSKLEKQGYLVNAPNIELIKKGRSLLKPNVSFHHVFSHTGKKDIHSIGNERADILASRALT